VVLRNNVVRGSVNANKRHWYKAGEALAKSDRSWLNRLITRREQPENFASALQRKGDDIKVVTIHHDTVELMEKQEKIKERELAAAVLLGPSRAHVLSILLIGKLHSLGYSRDVESRADLTGSDIFAQTGSNPWGLVWLFQNFKSANPNEIPQLLSNHSDDQNRIYALEHHFRQNPSVFAKFNPDPKSATPFLVPKNAQEVFLR
jgi:hypothetical protein